MKERVLLLNGATGANLLDKGLAPGESPSILNIRSPDDVYTIQKAYVDAGSDIILTNTFSANPMNIAERKLKTVLTEGIRIARHAAKHKAFVFADIGPLGELIKPYGELDFKEAQEIYSSICRTFRDNGIKTFFIETFTSIIDAKAAFLAARCFSNDIFICMSLQDNGRTIMGETPEAIAVTFDALNARGVGINCTLPDVACEAIQKMARVTNLPLIIKPNAGSIEIKENQIHHSLSDAEMARYYRKFIKAGANIIGGCCGTTPAYIRLIAKKTKRPVKRSVAKCTYVTSASKVLAIGESLTFIVGERLNPSGRKKVKQSLEKGDYSVYAEEARRQQEAGADVLDVNAFVVDKDEKESLERAVFEVAKSSNLPLFIDTQNYVAAQRVLSRYPGIGVLNSIPARKKELYKWLPMVKEYGFKAIISLVGKTIPRTVKQRLHNVQVALHASKKVGFPREDLIFDPLVFSIATEKEQVAHTLETVSILNKRGFKTVLGISNVSFGLPGRSRLNAALAAVAMKHGVAFLIVNPLDEAVMESIIAALALFKGSVIPFSDRMRRQTIHQKKVIVKDRKQSSLIDAVVHGNGQRSSESVRALLDAGLSAQRVIDDYIAVALRKVGDNYEAGVMFIPDLLAAADASKQALRVVREYLPKKMKQGTIMLATVKGDIHDIGKNIAAMMFESAGYDVIDLGKDVSCEKIVGAVKKYKPDILGLSALLTTTMPEMERVIDTLRKKKLDVKVIIGGPNVSDKYARRIGACASAKDVLKGLQIVKAIM